MKKIVCLLLCLSLLVGCQTEIVSEAESEPISLESTEPVESQPVAELEMKPNAESEELIRNIAFNAINDIRNRDFAPLAEKIHPEKGVLFSPYAYILPEKNAVFTPEQVRLFGQDESRYTWGTTPGSGFDIVMSVEEYFSQYVYDQNFVYSRVAGINTIERISNEQENVTEIFPGCVFVEAHLPGSSELGWLDWASLKIVMEEYEGELKIIAVIHSSYVL